MGSKQDEDRKLGRFWEDNFAQIIIPLGFSAQNISPGGKVDSMAWSETGDIIYVQIRHKNPFAWPDIGKCYGYERYRLNKDLTIVQNGGVAIYVIHDYTARGKDSIINELADWYAQRIEYLASNIDKERIGPTYFGDEYVRLPICYWKVERFKPLREILEGLR